MNDDELLPLELADKIKPGPLSELYGFDAIMPKVSHARQRLTAPAETGQSKGESNGEI